MSTHPRDKERFSVEISADGDEIIVMREVACLVLVALEYPGAAITSPESTAAAADKERCVLMVTSQGKPDTWTLPKGGWEADESLHTAALREAFEEAGLDALKGSIAEIAQRCTMDLSSIPQFVNRHEKSKRPSFMEGIQRLQDVPQSLLNEVTRSGMDPSLLLDSDRLTFATRFWCVLVDVSSMSAEDSSPALLDHYPEARHRRRRWTPLRDFSSKRAGDPSDIKSPFESIVAHFFPSSVC